MTPLGKGLIIDETNSHYGGLYNGQLTINPAVRGTVESSDALIHIGPFPSDSNTGGWTQKLEPQHVIHLGWDRILVAGKRWDGIHFVPVLKRLLQKISTQGLKIPSSFLTLVRLLSLGFSNMLTLSRIAQSPMPHFLLLMHRSTSTISGEDSLHLSSPMTV